MHTMSFDPDSMTLSTHHTRYCHMTNKNATHYQQVIIDNCVGVRVCWPLRCVSFCLCACISQSVFVWFSAGLQVQCQRPLAVQTQQTQELFRHGVHAPARAPLVVIMMRDLPLQRVDVERPEAVHVHVLAQLHRHADQHEPRGEADLLQATALPEPVQAPQVRGAEKDHRLLGSDWLKGLKSCDCIFGVRGVGEGGEDEMCVPVHADVLHQQIRVVLQIVTTHTHTQTRQKLSFTCIHLSNAFIQMNRCVSVWIIIKD